MSWVMAGMASGAATMAGVQYVKGKHDAKKAEKRRPVYEIPDEIKQNLSQAQVMALEGLPTEQKMQFVNNQKQGTAYGLSQIGSRKGGLAGVSNLYEQEAQGQANLLAMDAQARRQNLLGLSQQRGIMADYRGQSYQLNQYNPWAEKRKQDEARTGALFQNLMSAGGVAAGGVGAMGGGTKKKDIDFNNPYGSNSPYGGANAGSFRNAQTDNIFQQQQAQSLQGGFNYGQMKFDKTNYYHQGGYPSQGLEANLYPYGNPWQINTKY